MFNVSEGLGNWFQLKNFDNGINCADSCSCVNQLRVWSSQEGLKSGLFELFPVGPKLRKFIRKLLTTSNANAMPLQEIKKSKHMISERSDVLNKQLEFEMGWAPIRRTWMRWHARNQKLPIKIKMGLKEKQNMV